MAFCTLGQASVLALTTCGVPRGRAVAWRAARSGAPHRTGAPVRRDSIEAGTFEDLFFAVPAKGETDRLARAAARALDAGRRLRREARTRALTAAEAAIAALTAGAVRVYEEILTLARLNRGQVFPSYDHLAGATGLGRATIARGLRVLERVGLLVTQRRFKRVEDGGQGAGPRYAQTSNAYRPVLPAGLLDFLPRSFRPAPLPDDQIQREADRSADHAAMLAGVSCRELATVTVGGALGRMLARLGAAIDAAERESHYDPQPLTESNKQASFCVGLAGQHVRPDGHP